MKRLFFAISLFAFSTSLISAQSDYNKGEFFIGYSHGAVDGSTSAFNTLSNFHEIGPERFHGFNASGVYNFSRYFGLKGDVSATYGSADFNGNIGSIIVPANLTSRTDNSLYNVVGGIQVKDNHKDRRFKPFAHLMVGLGHAKSDVENTCSPAPNCNPLLIPASRKSTGMAGIVGGGVDVKLNDRFDLRLIQMDYNPIKVPADTLHNVRFSVGVVIK